jgi:uncharacterized protein YdeI (YjbR/CyaY-like superfamily)
MIIDKTLEVPSRQAWRQWLAKHHATETSIWLIFYRKDSGKQSISYGDAVEEALCYGWIDSTLKSLDDQRYAQRFSARKKTSGLSQPNRERVDRLIAQGKMTSAGLAAIAHVFDPKKDRADDFVIAPDILQALKANPQAWANFQQFSPQYQRVRVAFVDSRRRHGKEFFDKALQHLVTMCEKNKRFGSKGNVD